MKRATRRSSIFQPPPAAVVEEKRIPASGFDTKFSLPSFTKKVEKLTEDQRAAISKTGFGNLLNIHYQMISKVLLNELIERWDSENNTFMLPFGEVTITPRDVALILGLQVVGKPVVLDTSFSDLEQEYGATPLNRKISISLLEKRLESIGGLVNEDFIRTFLLCTFGVFLFPNSSGEVDSRFLTLFEDLDTVHEYAWGEAVLEELFSWIQKRKDENVRFVGGCLLLLQVWYYEHIDDIGRPNLLFAEQFPRASRWESIKSSSFQRQSLNTRINKLEEDQITWVLHPTTAESEIDVVKHFLEAESAKEEVPDSEASDLECVDSVPSHPATKEIVPVECASNVDSDKGIHMDTELLSEVSGASLGMPVVISKSPAIPSRTRKGKECLQISPIKLGTPIQTQDHGREYPVKENAGPKELVIKLKEEIQELKQQMLADQELLLKFKAENQELKQQMFADQELLLKFKAENQELKQQMFADQELLLKFKAENQELKQENEGLKQKMFEDKVGLARLVDEYFNP